MTQWLPTFTENSSSLIPFFPQSFAKFWPTYSDFSTCSTSLLAYKTLQSYVLSFYKFDELEFTHSDSVAKSLDPLNLFFKTWTCPWTLYSFINSFVFMLWIIILHIDFCFCGKLTESDVVQVGSSQNETKEQEELWQWRMFLACYTLSSPCCRHRMFGWHHLPCCCDGPG